MKELFKYHENLQELHVNTLPDQNYYIPFAKGQDPFADREESEFFESLNGDWDFKFYESFFDMEDEDITKDNFAATIPVPSCIQMYGYDQAQYSNVKYPLPFNPPFVPDDNPVAIYRKKYKFIDNGLRHILTFEGVDSCFYLLINNQLFGYSQVSHGLGQFDITDAMIEGYNDIKVVVLKWSDGSYLEDQDKFRLTGIIRDVYILKRPATRINDYRITSTFSNDYKRAMLHLDIKSDVDYKIIVKDPTGLILDVEEVKGSAFIDITVDEPLLWNAETPYLYEITLESEDEVIGEAYGLREVTVEKNVIKINGQNIKFKGVNRHSSHPDTGAVVSKDRMINDLVIMKHFNINTIRTSHYPDQPEFYKLCDKFGFYVVSEADIETHAQMDYYQAAKDKANIPMTAADNIFEKAVIDRTHKLVVRDFNRSCIVFWSLGNESAFGKNFVNAAQYIKSMDNSRLVHYESTWLNVDESSTDCLDMDSYMYPGIIDLYKFGKSSSTKATFLCEYSHAMGNGPGDLEDYFKAFHSSDKLAGGCIWEFADHAVILGEKDGQPIYGYGGDSGETMHDGNFCMDGLMYPDRKPHVGFYELKNVFRPLRVEVEDVKKGMYIFKSYLDFVNFKDYYKLCFEVKEMGTVIKEGEVDVDILPHSEITMHIPHLTALTGENLLVKFIIKTKVDLPWMAAGTELGFDQLTLMADTRRFKLTKPKGKVLMNSKEDSKSITIIANDCEYVLSKKTGMLTSIKRNAHEFLADASSINLFRAPTDNDINDKNQWLAFGLDKPITKMHGYKLIDSGEDIIVKFNVDYTAVNSLNPCSVEIKYKFFNGGEVKISLEAKVSEELKFLPRFGLRFELDEMLENVAYYGYGPYESYIDKHQASYIDLFNTTVTDNYEPYVRPQENSSHYDTAFVKLNDGKYGLNINSNDNFSFNVSHYKQENLTNASHRHKLIASSVTELCIDSFMSGVGSNACGPKTKDEYLLVDKDIHFDFYITTEKM